MKIILLIKAKKANIGEVRHRKNSSIKSLSTELNKYNLENILNGKQ